MKTIKLKFLIVGITAGSILLSAIVQAEQTLTFRIGTGGAGGTYYPVGSTIASAISEPESTKSCDQVGMCGVRGVTANALITKASVQNVTEVQAGLMESGIVDAATLHFAYKGIKKFKNDKKENIRVIANLYPEDLHLVLPKGSKLKGLADLYDLLSIGAFEIFSVQDLQLFISLLLIAIACILMGREYQQQHYILCWFQWRSQR